MMAKRAAPGGATIDELASALRSHCDEAGIDVVHPFNVDWFNDAVEPSLRIPDGGRRGALGFLIGNTRRMWPIFARCLKTEPALLDSEHPLDAYVERAISEAATRSIGDRHRILFAHRMTPEPIAIQRVAHETGLAHLSPSHLSIHPTYGPWWSLRAVIVVEAAGPAGVRPQAPDPCTPCSKPCLVAFDRAVAAGDVTRSKDVERNWRSWALVRDVCPEGRAHRYGDDQLRYHYTKDRSILRLPIL